LTVGSDPREREAAVVGRQARTVLAHFAESDFVDELEIAHWGSSFEKKSWLL
jgi:hypothetical protein